MSNEHSRWASTSINVPETMIYTNPKGKQTLAVTLTKTGSIAAKLKEKAFKLVPSSNPQKADLSTHHNWASMSIEVPKTLTYTNAKGRDSQVETLNKAGNIATKTKQKAFELVPSSNPQKADLSTHHNWASMSIEVPNTLTYTNAKGKESQA